MNFTNLMKMLAPFTDMDDNDVQVYDLSTEEGLKGYYEELDGFYQPNDSYVNKKCISILKDKITINDVNFISVFTNTVATAKEDAVCPDGNENVPGSAINNFTK